MDVSIQLVPVLSDGELLVIVDGDVDSLLAYWFIVRVMKLGHVGMSEGLLSSKSFAWVELQEVSEKIQSVVRSSGKDIS